MPVSKLCKDYDAIQSYTDLPSSITAKIAHFFTHYKDLEANKWVKVDGWDDREAAHQEIMDSIKRFQAG